jgi:outer membrane lipoprotein-sorting protein
MMHIPRRLVARPLLALGAAAALVWVAPCSASASASASASDPVGHSAQAASGSAATADATLVSGIAAQLAHQDSVRARFRQTQTLSALSAPLVSTGTLVFSPQRGVIWHTEKPRNMTVVIGNANVTAIDADGRRSTRGAGSGGIAHVSKMLRAMLGGDLSALYSQFDVAAEGTTARWRLRLTPNQPQLEQAVKSLRMEGGAFLTMLEIVAANGDTTRIDFSGSERIDALSPAELAAFGAP